MWCLVAGLFFINGMLHRPFAACLLFLVVLCSSCVTPPKVEVDELVCLAKAKTNQGDYDGAIADCSKAIALNPKYASAYYNRATARKSAGDINGAIADLNIVIELDPKNSDAYCNRGTIKSATGDLDGAIADYSKSIKLDPRSSSSFNNRGNANRNRGDFPLAFADYNQAIALNPDNAVYYNNRGFAYMDAGQMKAALADFEKALSLRPKYVRAMTNRGVAKYAQGSLDGILEDLNQAVEMDQESDYPIIFFHLFLQKTGRGTKLAELEAAIPTWKDDWEKTSGLYITGKLTEAELLERAKKGRANEVREQTSVAYFYIGMLHVIAKDLEVARSWLERCLATKESGLMEYQLARGELANITQQLQK